MSAHHYWRHYRCALLALLLAAPAWTRAADAGTGEKEATHPAESANPDAVLEEVEVRGVREMIEFDPVRSQTTVTATELERRQDNNLLDTLRDTPGVSVNGGPLANGMRLNIRGFNDTEDVLIKLDGAIRNFEKYRFGSGVFVEPELLKQVEVTRGAAGTLQGSGALGGVVSMETKDARDLLEPGRTIGARVKTGAASNNNERLVSVSAYGVAFGALDLLANTAARDSGDIVTGSGAKLENSSTDHTSSLVKAKLQLQTDAAVTVANVRYKDEGLEPFDAAAGTPGLFGFVQRAVEDDTTTVNFNYGRAISGLLNLKGTLGYTDTSVADTGTSSSLIPPNTTNTFRYRIATLDLTNTSIFGRDTLRNALTYGVQYHRNERQSQTVVASASSTTTTDNLSQPSGAKAYVAYVVQDAIEIGALSLTAGLRHDRYRVEVQTEAPRQLLAAEGRRPVIEFTRTSPSVGAAYHLSDGGLTLFYNYSEAFRPPLVDEYFTQGPFSRCNRFFLGALAPASGICGDLYQPETAVTHEVGASADYPQVFGADGLLTAKVVYFRTAVENILESITAVTPTEVGQPGDERLRGVEFELRYRSDRWFGSLGLSAVRGQQLCQGDHPLIGLPGDTLAFTLGRIAQGGRLEYGYRLQAVDDRLIIVSAPIMITPCNTGLATSRQPGYSVHNLFLAWQPYRALRMNLAVNNLTGKEYFLSGGFGGSVGQAAAGRDLRLSLALTF